MTVFAPELYKIFNAMDNKGYKVFSNPKGYDLNIVGVRTDDQTANKFNDWITIFYDFDGNWNFFAFPATTDPGLYYRENPANVKGTAILVPGQHKGMWKMGKHQGKYKALVQNKPVQVYRDNDGDATLDTPVVNIETGLFGINMHRSNEGRASTQVDKWSAGCQVFQDPRHFQFALSLCQAQIDIHGWDSFTYTLLEEKDL